MENYDVIVIGAGNGGLIAAATAASKGLKTLLVEQHNTPGGFASSFVRGRFEFETALHELCDFGSEEDSGSIRSMFNRLGININWQSVPEAYKLITTDDPEGNLDLDMPFGVDNYLKKMEELVPGSMESVSKFIDAAKEIDDAFNFIAASHGHADKKDLIAKFPNFLKTAPYSVDEVEKAIKMPLKARRIINAYWCYLGIPTSTLNFTIYAVMFYKYLIRGAYFPENRSHEISTAIADRILKVGGEIWYNTKVDKIIVENNTAIGIQCKRGIIKAKEIISNASRTIVFSSMIDPDKVPLDEIKLSNARHKNGQGFCVFLGLNKSAQELGIKNYSMFVYPSMDVDKLYDSMKNTYGDKVIAASCLNVVNPNASPKGTCILSFTTLLEDDAFDYVTTNNYFQEKNRIADNLISYFERGTGIKIRDSIEEISVATPATFAHFTGAYRGLIYGYDANSVDGIMPRLLMLDEDIRIKHLRFCGGFEFRMHGYGSAYNSGETSALKAFSEITREAKNNE